MADQLDDRPVFTIVMGCNGSGNGGPAQPTGSVAAQTMEPA